MKHHLKRQFFSAVLPSMLAFMFSGIYAIVDGFFVGRNVGDTGLAAVNIAYPLVALLQAAGTGIGMGGAIRLSIEIGRGNDDARKSYAKMTLILLLAASAVISVILFFVYRPVLVLFGAEGDILTLACEYMVPIVLGAVFQIFGTGLVPLLRNFNDAVGAMLAMIAGFLTNVALDWLFVSVWSMGMRGAALATVIGQAVTFLCCCIFLQRQKLWHFIACGKLSASKIPAILIVAVSPFGLTLSPNLVIMIINKAAAIFGTSKDIACYAVISYAICVAQLLLQGVGDGVQPLISLHYGRGESHSAALLRKYAYLCAAATSIIGIVVLFLCRHLIPIMFGTSPDVAGDIAFVLPIFLSGLIFVAFLRVTIAYFYATEQNKLAYLLIYGEPLLLIVLYCILPNIFGMTGVWAGVPINQAILSIAALMILTFQKKKHV